MSVLGCFRILLASAMVIALAGPAIARQPLDPVTVAVQASKTRVAPGDLLPIAVVLDHEPGWHTHTNSPVLTPGMVREKFEAIPTTIEVKAGPGITVWPTQWPPSTPTRVVVSSATGPEQYGVFAGHAVAFVPIQIPPSAQPGSSLEVEVKVGYQACDEKACRQPADASETVTFQIAALPDVGRSAPQPDPDFAGFDPTVFSRPPTGVGTSNPAHIVRFAAFGIGFAIDPAGVGFLLLLLVAALGGFLLNFTPCVLPVVPLKIMGLSQAAGNPARCLFLGSVMSLGVVAFWVAIGAAIAFISGFTAINSLFQTPWFSLSVGLFILLMSVGMLGLYSVRLPQAVYLVNPSHDTAGGSFIFGIMTAVLSTPCTAPFMGSAAAWAATQRPPTTLATFGAIGVGMALPYLVLSAFPGLLRRFPRTGPGSELIKQVMGLLMIAVAIFFLGTGLDPLLRQPVDQPIRFYWWGIAGVSVAAMAWLVVRTFRITRRALPRIVWTTVALLFSAVTVAIAREVTDLGPIAWVGYTPERFADQLARRRVVVLDFTAEWCLNCKALESGVLHRPEIVRMLTNPDVVPMRVDLTGNNRPGKQKLKELNWVGIPLLAIYGPGTPDPITYDAYTPDMVRQAIIKAAGGNLPGLASAPSPPVR